MNIYYWECNRQSKYRQIGYEDAHNRHEPAAISDVILVDVERVGVASLYAAFLGRDQRRADSDDLSRRVMLLAAHDGGHGGVLEHVCRRQRSGRTRRRIGDVHLGRPGIMIDAGVYRSLFCVRFAAHDHPETAAVTLKTGQTAAEAG